LAAAIYLPIGLTLLLRLLAPAFVNRLAPRGAAIALTAAGVVLAASCLLSIVVLAVIGLTEAAVALHGPQVLSGPGGRELVADPVAALAPVLACTGLVAALRVIRRVRSATRSTNRMLHSLTGDADDVAVSASDVPYAFALPGRPGRVVVSTAMFRLLDSRQHRVVLAHERAHLRHRHHVYQRLARVAASNPLLSTLPAHVDHALERWADEESAECLGDRSLVAQTLGRAALARLPATGLGPLGVLTFARDAVASRMVALLAPRPPRVPVRS